MGSQLAGINMEGQMLCLCFTLYNVKRLFNGDRPHCTQVVCLADEQLNH